MTKEDEEQLQSQYLKRISYSWPEIFLPEMERSKFEQLLHAKDDQLTPSYPSLRRYREIDFKTTYKGNICWTFCKPYDKNIKSWQSWQKRGWETTILINSLMCPQSQSPPSHPVDLVDIVFFQSYFCSHLQITLGNFGESLSPLLTSFGLERVGTPRGKSLIRRLIFQMS